MDGRVLAIVLLALSVILALRRRKNRGPALPGPPQLPIIGNILPRDQPWEAMRQYSLKYGPVVALRVLSTRIITVNSVSAAAEFCESRSSVYSQRIPMKMPEMAGMVDGVLFETDPVRLRLARKLVASGIGPRELENFRPQMRAHIVHFLGMLLRKPEKFLDHIRDLPIGMLLEVTYGYKATSAQDHFVVEADTLVHNFAEASAIANYLVNWMPLLAYVPGWVPGAAFQDTAVAWRKQAVGFEQDTYNYVVKSMADGMAESSVVSKAIESKDLSDKSIIPKVALQMVSGGADTTVSAMGTFILAMVLLPDVQRKAQAEIDKVVGSDRLPSFTDRPNLPFIEAIMKETLRWHPPIATVPRNSSKDDVYEGCFIPKGSVILLNFWAMLHNEDVFPDPMSFKPERWFDLELTKEIDPLYIEFGYGRRACPGKDLAVELLFTVMTNILAMFDISKAHDADGNEITPSGEFSSDSISAPLPFECEIKSRSQHALEILRFNLEEVSRG